MTATVWQERKEPQRALSICPLLTGSEPLSASLLPCSPWDGSPSGHAVLFLCLSLYMRRSVSLECLLPSSVLGVLPVSL